MVLRISQAGKDGGKVCLTLLAGIEGKIRANDAREPGLEGITGGRENGNMELTFFLLGGIRTACMEVLQEGAAQVNQIKLIAQRVLGNRPENRKGQEGYEQVWEYTSDQRVSGLALGRPHHRFDRSRIRTLKDEINYKY